MQELDNADISEPVGRCLAKVRVGLKLIEIIDE
jgi:hypothetical protein